MKLNVKLAEKIVGLFILVAILGIVSIIIFLGLNQRWLKKNYHFSSIFQSAKSLSQGMPITLRGFNVGKVEKLELHAKDKNVKMTFYIYEEFYEAVAFKNSIIELASSPIGLGSSLIFHPGLDTNLLEPEGTVIPVYGSEDAMKLISMKLVDRAPSDDSIGSLLAQVNPILQQIPPALYSVRDLIGELSGAIKGTENTQLGVMLINVSKTLDNAQATLKTVDSILNGTGTTPLNNTFNNLSSFSDGLGKLMQNVNVTLTKAGTIVDDVSGTIKNAGGIVDDVKKTISHEVENIDKLMADLKDTTANIEKLTADPTGLVIKLLDPKGSLKTFLDDDNKLFNTIDTNLQQLLDKVQQMLKKLDDLINGVAPQLTGLLEEGKSALNKGQDVLEGLSNNPLLKGGIQEKREQPGTFNSYRDEEF